MQTQVSQGVHYALALKGLNYVQQYSWDLKSDHRESFENRLFLRIRNLDFKNYATYFYQSKSGHIWILDPNCIIVVLSVAWSLDQFSVRLFLGGRKSGTLRAE